MKRLSLILAVLLLASCSGMRSQSNSSGASGTSGASGSGYPGTEQNDLYRPGR